jgi:hypothetical protein
MGRGERDMLAASPDDMAVDADGSLVLPSMSVAIVAIPDAVR